MINKDELNGIIKRRIDEIEKPGEHIGGSGNIAYVSFSLDEVKTEQLENEFIEVAYSYTVFVETEFTIYPDNPPMEYSKTDKMIIDKKGNIIGGS